MHIDILLAVYNNEEFLAEQLRSLIKQTYPHFRIIARDDVSTDRSVAILKEFSSQHPGRLTLIEGDRNLGARGNFSSLISEANAPYVMFCDGDDLWHPTKIEDTLVLMKENEKSFGVASPLLIHTDLAVVNKELELIDDSFWHYSQLNPIVANRLNRLLTQNVITGCTMMINRPLLELAAPIPDDAIMHDWWIGLVACAFGHIDFLPKATMLYRQHGKNDTGAKDWTSWKNYWVAAKKALYAKGRKELKRRLERTMQQAALFSLRYRKKLFPHHQRILDSYLRMGEENFIHRRALFLRHRFFKNSLAKNVGMFLFL